MKLVPFSHQYLRLKEPLPFGLRDGSGKLLLGAGLSFDKPERLVELSRQPLFADEAESADWNRRLAAAMDALIRQGAQLRQVVAARPEAQGRAAAPAAEPLGEQWRELVAHLDSALRDLPADGGACARIFAVHGQARQLYRRRPDASLYQLIFEAGNPNEKYSAHHALLTLLICEEAAAKLAWPQEWIDSLGCAALTMNVAMLRLQGRLALAERPVSAEERAAIDSHAEKGACMLEEAGLVDRLCLAVVRLHHDAGLAGQPLAELPPEWQLARLLRRVDIFSALLSSRSTRAAMSPVQAARLACLGPNGAPDEIGGALLKAVGLYPPGSFVELVNGEVCIVVARGRRANLPVVATLVSATGSPLAEPLLRDTLDQRYGVKAAVSAAAVKVRPPHERLMAMR